MFRNDARELDVAAAKASRSGGNYAYREGGNHRRTGRGCRGDRYQPLLTEEELFMPSGNSVDKHRSLRVLIETSLVVVGTFVIALVFRSYIGLAVFGVFISVAIFSFETHVAKRRVADRRDSHPSTRQ